MPGEDERRKSPEAPGGIDPGHESLHGGLLVSGRPVDLSREVQTINFFRFQGVPQLRRREEVVLDGVPRSEELGILQARDAVNHFHLDIQREAVARAVRIDLRSVPPFRLDENVVLFPPGELDDLVLDGRTVTGASDLDHAAVEGGIFKVRTDDFHRPGRGMRQKTGHSPASRIPRGKRQDIGRNF